MARGVLARAAMKWRRLTLLIAVFVTLDFADPWTPGALSFDPGIDAIAGASLTCAQRAVTPPAARAGVALTSLRRPVPPPCRAPAARERFVDLWPTHSTSSDPPPPGDDH